MAAHHLDTVQSMLNLIFIQSGRFVKEAQAANGTGRQRLAMQRAVPAATERFHDALDELENEVRLAQTVLRRDLALLKQARNKKEAVAKQHEAEKARLAAAARAVPVARDEPSPQAVKVATPVQPEPPAPGTKPASAQQPDEAPKPKDEPAPPPPILTTAEPERDPLFDGTPTTANAHESEFDFDAIFGDAMDTSGADPAHSTAQSDIMDTSGDLPFSLDDGADGNEGPSLLRGLEDFAKSGGDDGDANAARTSTDMDFPMPDLSDLNANPSAPAEPVSQPPPATAAKPAETQEQRAAQPAVDGAADVAVDTTADSDMMATLGADDLEDLFNMDDYQTQENSSFDDAFWLENP